MHSTESRVVIGPSNILFEACMCAFFSPENLRAGAVKGLKGRGFESLQERRGNFLLRGQPSVLTLISVSVLPPCYRSSTSKIPVILPKVQVTAKHTDTLRNPSDLE